MISFHLQHLVEPLFYAAQQQLAMVAHHICSTHSCMGQELRCRLSYQICQNVREAGMAVPKRGVIMTMRQVEPLFNALQQRLAMGMLL